MKKTVMRKYAQLAVRRGAHVKKGQGCVIYAQVEQHEFAQMVAEEAYRAGAKWVEMRWEDQVCTKLKYRHETLTQLSQVAEWEKARMQHYVDTLPAMIHISSADPDGLKGVNVEKMQKSGAARGMALKSYHDALDNKYQWCIIAVPSKKVGQEGLPRGAHQRRGGKAVGGHPPDGARHRGQRPHGRVGGPRQGAESPL